MAENVASKKAKEHERVWRLFGGYAAFIASLMLLVMAKGAELRYGWLALTCFAISLPMLIAGMLLDYHVRVTQGRDVSGHRGAALYAGVGSGLTGMEIVLAHFSITAAIALSVAVFAAFVAILRVSLLGSSDPSDDI